MRLTGEQLEEVKKKYGVDELWSFSKFDCYRTSHYEWFLKYILKLKPNADIQSIYGSLGGCAHDILQDLYEDKIAYEDMADKWDEDFMLNTSVYGLKFDRGDESKNKNISDKYYQDILHFFKHYKKLPYKMNNEKFMPIKITDDIVLQGYLDAFYVDENKTITIIDYKTSTAYTGDAIRQHSHQLLLYAEALRQQGVPKDHIKVGWMFLKYVSVDYEQINGKIKNRKIERYKIGESLQSSAKVWLKKLGYEEQMMEYLDALMQNNDISVLPIDVQSKFVISDCYVFLDDIWNAFEELKEEIIETISEIREKVKEYELTHDEYVFWDSDESLKEQSYYYNNLCDYNFATMKPYADYVNRLKAEKEGGLLGVPKKDDDSYDEFSLDWLNEL